MIRPDFSSSRRVDEPFPSIRVEKVVPAALAGQALDWFDEGAPWRLRETDFYEQHEFSLLTEAVPPSLGGLTSAEFVGSVSTQLRQSFAAPALKLVDVTAHRLTSGQTIRVHNDYLGGEESHRLLIQLNRGWSPDKGGYLMLFGNDRPESAAELLLPEHRSAFGFEISPKSYHAVSTVRSGERYTLVYTFRAETA